jgi:sulfotransferase family protein
MKPIFIGGTGRSGTTVLKRIFACHSRIAALRDELRIIVDPGGALDLVMTLCERWSPHGADLAIHEFRRIVLDSARARTSLGITLQKVEKNLFRKIGVSPRRYLGAGFSRFFGRNYLRKRLDRLTNELSYHASRGSWAGSLPFQFRSQIFEGGPYRKEDATQIVAGFLCDLYGRLAGADQSHWIDDTPTNLLFAHELVQLFPQMKLIHIYRDPRDVMASFRGFKWGGDDFVSIARRLAGIYERWFEIRQTLPPGYVTEIGLEALAQDPPQGIRQLCAFIGLEFQDSLLKVRLDKTNSGRWKREIPEDLWPSVKPYLSRAVEAYGYASF